MSFTAAEIELAERYAQQATARFLQLLRDEQDRNPRYVLTPGEHRRLVEKAVAETLDRRMN